jgi:hypothetical protein
MTFDRSLLNEPDAVLMLKENDRALLEFITPYTVPIIFFAQDAKRETLSDLDVDDVATGILIEIGGQHFIATAGHCVRKYRRTKLNAFGVSTNPHCYIPEKWPNEFVDDDSTGEDYGYIHIPSTEVSNFTSGKCVFAGMNRIQPMTSEEIRAKNDWMIISGYPFLIQEQREDRFGARLLMYPTTLSATGEAPPSTLPVRNCIEHADLWVPRNTAVMPAEDYESTEVPLLGGASGGGCWLAGVRNSSSPWVVSNLRLVGTHAISTKDIMVTHKFAREISIGHHLRLIADKMPVVRKHILDRWPFLGDSRWTRLR